MWNAEADDANAQYRLGVMYFNGLGVPTGLERARQCLERAADLNHSEAQFALGTFYQHGDVYGVPQDYQQARRYYKQAAVQRHIKAVVAIGYFYQHGLGLPAVNYERAREHFEQAAQENDADAQFYLGALYERARGVKQDFGQARFYYEAAAARGQPDAQCNLGNLYVRGRGVAQDFERAHYYFEQAAARGDNVAQNNLGSLYANGLGVPQDYELARQYYEEAAAAGNADALYNLEILDNPFPDPMLNNDIENIDVWGVFTALIVLVALLLIPYERISPSSNLRADPDDIDTTPSSNYTAHQVDGPNVPDVFEWSIPYDEKPQRAYMFYAFDHLGEREEC